MTGHRGSRRTAKALTFYSNQSGKYDGWSIRLDGSGRTRLTDLAPGVAYTMFAPDGKRLMVAGSDTGAVIGEAPWPITRQSAKPLSGLDVKDGSLTPSTWSRDGRWLAGAIVEASGELSGFGLYDIVAGHVRRLNRDSRNFELAWLPGSRRVVYFTDRGTLVMQDIESLQRREVGTLPYPPALLGNIVASSDGRTLYYGAQQSQANIWLVKPSAHGVKR